ncbi:MAG: GMC family oxidoreductase [Polyangiales bacterium]
MPGETHFDVVVVGSGYGGAVVAHRLAEAGRRVCLLERGKAYPPGSFPRSPNGVRRNFWDPSEGLHGLFDVWSFRGLAAVVASGLGGGSLLTSNVLIRKDEDTFVHEDFPIRRGASPRATRGYEHWPITRADLEPHYDAVEKMLDGQPYPYEASTPKTQAMREGATKLGLKLDLPKLAVTFSPRKGAPPIPGEPITEEHRNLHDRTRDTCRLCGECNVGCNFGSKNTLDYNYLSTARRHGADLRTRCEVREISRREGGGFLVRYVDHGEGSPDAPSADRTLHTVTARRVVLAAGALGSTFLLFKNRHHLPGLSARLGSQVSGNGDLLTFLDRCRDPGTRAPRRFEPEHGPVITSSIRVPNGPSTRGFYLEDAGYPQGGGFLIEAIDTPSVLMRMLGLTSRVLSSWLGLRRGGNLSAAVARAFGDAARSSSTLPLLAMGRDVPDGRASLDPHGNLDIDWAERGSDAYFTTVRDTVRRLAEALGGTLRDDPIWLLNRLITVHPLGGAPMGRDVTEGVVDSYGEVFNHPGLFVADGSIMPGPVGANPSLTIAAMADRIATRMLEA